MLENLVLIPSKTGSEMKNGRLFYIVMLLALSSGCAQQSVEEMDSDKTTPKAPVAPSDAETEQVPVDEQTGEEAEAVDPEAEHNALMGYVTTETVTSDENLKKLLEKWKRRPVSKSEKKEVKKKKKAWKDSLMKAILHEEPNVRTNVAAALASLGKDKAVTKLFIDRMQKEEDGDVRGHIAKQFVTYKDKTAQSALIEMMRNDKNPSARGNAAWALSKHGDKAVAQPFLEALQDPESWVRLYAVNGVKRLRVKKAIPTLRVLLSDKSDLVAKKAKEALKSLGAR